MRKLVIVFLVILIVGCGRQPTSKSEPHKLLKKMTIEYEKTDSLYRYYGCYREDIYKYNYQYKDSVSHSFRYIDTKSGETYYINEYDDTVRIVYTDYRDYPRREE